MRLIGRETELADVAERIASGRRMITVIGPGGIGKTSLATTVLDHVGSGFPLGAHVVDLSRIDRPDAVAGAVAAQLGFSSFENLIQSPGEQPALLLVDNCEHVSDAAANAIATLLHHCQSPTVLATSRSPLDLPGESVVALAPLQVPDAGAPDAPTSAVQLFCERARDAGVTLDDDQLPLVAELCRRLDGLPLAIEIAAARTRSLALADIAQRLEAGIAVLSRPRFRGSSRHRSLSDTIGWSYRLLDEEAQAAFDRLGVCVGPFPLELAAAVAFDSPTAPVVALDVLERLIDASLLVVERHPSTTRYRMFETIRAVALGQLEARGELRSVRDRYTTEVLHMVGRISDAGRRRWGPDLLPALLDHFDYIDTALRYCLSDDEDPARAFALYSALWGTVHQARVDEVLRLGLLVMERWPDPGVTSGAGAAATLAIGHLLCGHTDDAVALADRALPHADDDVFATVALRRVLGLAARANGDNAGAAAIQAEAAAAAWSRDVPTMAMECEVYRAQDLAAGGDTDAALRVVRDVARAANDATSVLNELWARTVEGAILIAVDVGAAQPIVESTLAAAEAIDYPFGVTCNLQSLVRCHLATGSIAAAAAATMRLFDAVGRSGAGDLRLALDLAASLLLRAGRAGWEDLIATAATLPNTNPMVMGSLDGELPPGLDGRVLPRGDAIRLARRSVAEVASATTTPAVAGAVTADAAFVRVGDVWEVSFGGRSVLLKSSRGMDDLAVLLARPGRDVHCLELAGARVEESSTGEVIDATAKRRYEERVRELQADIDDAEADHNTGRAERARVELDTLVDHLTAALGLGTRTRQQAGTAERARSAVTQRLRATMRRIAEVHPTLGQHLRTSVSTGLYCCYRPVPPTNWRT